jgi:hypothetical protein
MLFDQGHLAEELASVHGLNDVPLDQQIHLALHHGVHEAFVSRAKNRLAGSKGSCLIRRVLEESSRQHSRPPSASAPHRASANPASSCEDGMKPAAAFGEGANRGV